MKLRPAARAVRYLVFSTIALGAFEACSGSSNNSVAPPPGVSGIAIASTHACDNSLLVSLTLTNLHLKPPGVCGTTAQCGSIAVSLLETQDGAALLAPVRAATSDVQIDISSLVSPPAADAPALSQVHFIKVQVYDDSLSPYPAAGGGDLVDVEPVTLSYGVDCAAGDAGAANAAGDTGNAGAGNAGASSGGQGGEGGVPNGAGMAGAATGGMAGEGGSFAGEGG